MDKTVLTQCNGFAKALIMWFVSHYVLNLEYARKIREVALFLSRVCNHPATAADKKLKNATYLFVTTDIQEYAMCQLSRCCFIYCTVIIDVYCIYQGVGISLSMYYFLLFYTPIIC